MTDLPDKIKIGTFTYDVQYLDMNMADWGFFGKCDCNEHIIKIALTDGDRVINTLIHEITHAIFYEYNLGKVTDDDMEEWVTTVLANGWTRVYQDNPILLDVFKEHFDEGT